MAIADFQGIKNAYAVEKGIDMRNFNSWTKRLIVSALSLALLISWPAVAFGRDKNDQGKGNGKGRQKQERGDRGGQKEQDHGKLESRRGEESGDRDSRKQRQRSDNESRRQQRQSDSGSRRHQERSDWNSQMQQQRSDAESRREQDRSNRESHRQRQSSDRQSPREREIWNGEISRRQQVGNDPGIRRGDDDDRRSRGRDNRNNRDGFINRTLGRPVWRGIFGGGQPIWNYSLDNSKLEKRFYKNERKAQRRYEKEQRRYARSNNRSFGGDYYANNNYHFNDYGYDNGPDWQQQILRVVIANVIGNRLGGDQYSSVGQYAPVYRNQLFYDNYDQRGYAAVPQYARNYYQPSGYQPDYGTGGDLFDGNLPSGGLLDSLPIAELINQYKGGGGFASELIGNFLTQGYDQGFLAGQSARQNGYDDENYADPYTYDGGSQDPYSASVGENRRYLSQGYEIGYQDALNGGSGYDPQSDGNTDLVSLLLSNVLSGV